MNADENKRESACSGVPRIERIPDFKSGIPIELVEQLDSKYQALFRAISVMERMDEWTAGHVLQHNKALHRLCSDVEEINRLLSEGASERKVSSAKWSLPLIVATIAGSVVLTKFCEKILSSIWP